MRKKIFFLKMIKFFFRESPNMEKAVKYIFLDAISYSTDPEEIAESMKAGLVIIIRRTINK